MSSVDAEFGAMSAQDAQHSFRSPASDSGGARAQRTGAAGAGGGGPRRAPHRAAGSALTSSALWAAEQKEPSAQSATPHQGSVVAPRTKAGGVRHRGVWSDNGSVVLAGSSASNSRKQTRIAHTYATGPQPQHSASQSKLSASASKRSLASSTQPLHSSSSSLFLPPLPGALPPPPGLSWLGLPGSKPPNLMAWVRSISRLDGGGPVQPPQTSRDMAPPASAELVTFEQLQLQFANTFPTPEQFQAFYFAQQQQQAQMEAQALAQAQAEAEHRHAAEAAQRQKEPSSRPPIQQPSTPQRSQPLSKDPSQRALVPHPPPVSQQQPQQPQTPVSASSKPLQPQPPSASSASVSQSPSSSDLGGLRASSSKTALAGRSGRAQQLAAEEGTREEREQVIVLKSRQRKQQAGSSSSAAAANNVTVQLSVQCTGLPDSAHGHRCDPVVVLYRRAAAPSAPDAPMWVAVSRTERLVSTSDPLFRRALTATLRVNAPAEAEGDLRLAVYDASAEMSSAPSPRVSAAAADPAISERHLLGEHFFSLRLLLAHAQTQQRQNGSHAVSLDLTNHGRIVPRQQRDTASAAAPSAAGSTTNSHDAAQFTLRVLNLADLPAMDASPISEQLVSPSVDASSSSLPSSPRQTTAASQIVLSVSVRGLDKKKSPQLVLYLSSSSSSFGSRSSPARSFELFAQSERRVFESSPQFESLFVIDKEMAADRSHPRELKLCVYDGVAAAAAAADAGTLLGQVILPLSSLLVHARQDVRLSLPSTPSSSAVDAAQLHSVLTVQSLEVGRITKAFVAVTATGLRPRNKRNSLNNSSIEAGGKCDPIAALHAHNPFLHNFTFSAQTERVRCTDAPTFHRLLPVDCWSDLDRPLRVAIYDADADEMWREKDLMGEVVVSLRQLTTQAELAASAQRDHEQRLKAQDAGSASPPRPDVSAGLFVQLTVPVAPASTTTPAAASPSTAASSPPVLSATTLSSFAAAAPLGELYLQLVWDSSEWVSALQAKQADVERKLVLEREHHEQASKIETKQQEAPTPAEPESKEQQGESSAAAGASNSVPDTTVSASDESPAITAPRISDEEFSSILAALTRPGARLFASAPDSDASVRAIADQLVWRSSAGLNGLLRHFESFESVGRSFQAFSELLPAVLDAEKSSTHLSAADIERLISPLGDPATSPFRSAHHLDLFTPSAAIPGAILDALVVGAGGVEPLLAHMRAFASVGRKFASVQELIDAMAVVKSEVGGNGCHLAPEDRAKLMSHFSASNATGKAPRVPLLQSGVVFAGSDLDSLVSESSGVAPALDSLTRLRASLQQFGSFAQLLEGVRRLRQGLSPSELVSASDWSAVVSWITAPSNQVFTEAAEGVAVDAAVLDTLLQRTGGLAELMTALRELETRNIKLRTFADLLQAIPQSAAAAATLATTSAAQSASTSASQDPTPTPAPAGPQPPIEAESKSADSSGNPAPVAEQSSSAVAAESTAASNTTSATVAADNRTSLSAAKSELSAFFSTARAQTLFPAVFAAASTASSAAVDVLALLSLSDSDVQSSVSLGGGSLPSLLSHLDLFVSVARTFESWADLLQALRDVAETGSHVNEDTRATLLQYLSSDSCHLFDGDATPKSLEIDMESIDSLLASANGLDNTMTHLKIMNACGRRMTTWEQLSQAIVDAEKQVCHVLAEDKLTLRNYLVSANGLFVSPLSLADTESLSGLEFDRFFSCSASKGWVGLVHHFAQFQLAARKFASVEELLVGLERVSSGDSYVTEETRESLIGSLADLELFADGSELEITGADLDAMIYAGRGLSGAVSHLRCFAQLHRKFTLVSDLIQALRAVAEDEQAGGGSHLLEADRQQVAAQLTRSDSTLLLPALQPTAILQGAALDALALAAGGHVPRLLELLTSLEPTQPRCTSWPQLVELVQRKMQEATVVSDSSAAASTAAASSPSTSAPDASPSVAAADPAASSSPVAVAPALN